MSNYTKNTNFSAKDSLPTGDPNKIILGSLFDSEFDEIAVAIASKEDAANKNQNNGYAGLDSSGKLPTSLFGNATVPDAALSSNVPLKNAASNSFTGNVTVGGTISGSGAGITGVVHTTGNEIIGGLKRFTTPVHCREDSSYGYLELASGTATHTGYVGFLAPNGNLQGYIGRSTTSGATNTGTIPYVAGTHAFTGNVTVTGSISGSGTGLTNIPDGALSSNVPLKNAANTFTGGIQTLASTAGQEQLRLVHDNALLTFFNAANSARSGYLWMRASGDSLLWVEANQALQIGTNNTGRMTIRADGNVTIDAATNGTAVPALRIGGAGTTDGGYQLSVLGSGTNNAFGLRDTLNNQEFRIGAITAGGGYTVGTYTNHSLSLLTNNTTRITIGTTGGVQIGSPTGGDKGAGTVNSAGDIYINNVSVRDASGINAGTLNDARLSSNVPLKNAASNSFTGNLSVSGTISGNGSGLTSLNASNLSSGTIPDARFPATLPAASGANLTSLNASNISSGTLNNARLPSTINVTTLQQGGVNVASLPAVTSTSTTLAAGQAHYITGNATLPALAAGEWVSIINNSGSPITISESLGYTTYWTSSGASVSTVTLAARGRLFAEGVGSGVAYVSGDITGFT